MPKFTLTAFIFFLFTTIAYGQNEVGKYCEVTCSTVFLSKNIKISISFGKENPLSSDTANRNKIVNFIQINKFESDVDILNYMSSQGWTLKSSCLTEDVNGGSSSAPVFIFFFEKIFRNI
jgi:hypothetical protein